MRRIKGYCAVHKAWHKVTKIILSRTISYLNVAKLQLKMTTSTMMLCVLYNLYFVQQAITPVSIKFRIRHEPLAIFLQKVCSKQIGN